MYRRSRSTMLCETKIVGIILVILGSLWGTPSLLLAQSTNCANAELVPIGTNGVYMLDPGDQHFFRIATPAQGRLILWTEGTTDTFGTLWDPQGIELASDHNSLGFPNFRIISALVPAAPDYCLRVMGSSANTAGLYRLRVEGDFAGVDDHGVDCASATEVNSRPGEPLEILGTLSLHGDQDFFRIKIPTGGGSLTVSTGGTTDTFCILWDADSIELASDHNGLGFPNCRISLSRLAAGEYCAAVLGAATTTTGIYKFRVDSDSAGDDHGVNHASPTMVRDTVAPVENILGALSVYGDQDFFQIQTCGGILTVSTEGTTDTFCILWDADGIELASDHNGAGFPNCRISLALPAGVYSAAVLGSSPTTTGTYKFRVAGNCNNPPATCGGRVVTIYGTEGDDVLYGTPVNDVIAAFGGNDIVHGLGGNDIICGGDGDDVLLGGDGNDRLYGGAGNDILRGEDGNDLLVGSQGNDILDGGPGQDRVFGSAGNDILVGGTQDDQLDGGSGIDSCDGGDGTDTDGACEVLLGIP